MAEAPYTLLLCLASQRGHRGEERADKNTASTRNLETPCCCPTKQPTKQPSGQSTKQTRPGATGAPFQTTFAQTFKYQENNTPVRGPPAARRCQRLGLTAGASVEQPWGQATPTRSTSPPLALTRYIWSGEAVARDDAVGRLHRKFLQISPRPDFWIWLGSLISFQVPVDTPT